MEGEDVDKMEKEQLTERKSSGSKEMEGDRDGGGNYCRVPSAEEE